MQLALRRTQVRRPSRPAATFASRPAVVAAVVLSLLAGWVHLAYTASHFRSWWLYGVFFLAAGLGQGLLGAALVRWPSPGVALAGVVGNLGVVMMYVISRTEGVPIGPHANVVERATTIDLLTTAGEIVLIVLLLAMLGRMACRIAMNIILVLGVVLWVGRLTGQIP